MWKYWIIIRAMGKQHKNMLNCWSWRGSKFLAFLSNIKTVNHSSNFFIIPCNDVKRTRTTFLNMMLQHSNFSHFNVCVVDISVSTERVKDTNCIQLFADNMKILGFWRSTSKLQMNCLWNCQSHYHAAKMLGRKNRIIEYICNHWFTILFIQKKNIYWW